MEFVNLQNLLDNIAENLPETPQRSIQENSENPWFVEIANFWNKEIPTIDRENRFSEAVRLLNQAWRHSDNCPQWFELDNEKDFPVNNKALSSEGIDMLTQATVLPHKLSDNRVWFIGHCRVNNWDLLTTPVCGTPYTIGKNAFHTMNVGFDRKEIFEATISTA